MDSVSLAVENPATKLDGVKLLFEVERANGDITASGPVALGADGRTTFATWHDFAADEIVTFRVRAVHDELANVAVAKGTFTVRKKD